ncbi:hypothetical protein ACFWZ2_04840 [Streptomyces sp. NPDC059002]|uniref:hypothetical protein n=1 Tax=Streptomyces sp. NPDC059002 TaxID=3346690 RepID=UPI0036BAAD94
MSTARRALGAVASATLVVLAAPAVAHADGEGLASADVPAFAKVKQPVDAGQLESVPKAVQKMLDKLAMNRNDKLRQSALGG